MKNRITQDTFSAASIPGDEGPAPAVDIPQTAHLGGGDGHHQEVNEDHPEGGEEVSVEGIGDGGKGKDHDGAVQRPHQGPRDQDEEHDSLAWFHKEWPVLCDF